MATQSVAAYPYKGGEIVEFVNYEQPLEDGQKPLLNPGEKCRVTGVNKEGGLTVVVIGADGKPVKGREGDMVFAEEVKFVEAPVTVARKGKAEAEVAAVEKPEPAKTKATPPAKAVKAASAPASASAGKLKVAKGTTAKAAKKAAKAEKLAALTEKAEKAEKLKAAKAEKAEKLKAAKAAKAEKLKAAKVAKAEKLKAAKAAKAEKLAAEKAKAAARQAIMHDATVLELISTKGALVAAKELALQHELTYFQLGGVLVEIESKKLHETAGFEGTQGLNAYVETELGIDYRKAKDLMYIYEVFRDPRVLKRLTPNRLSKLGWAKARTIARVGAEVLADKFDELYEFASGHNKEDTLRHIQTRYKVARRGEGNETVKVTTFSFRLSGEAADNVIKGLDQAKQLVGNDDPSSAFEYIVGEWRQLVTGVKHEPSTLDELIELAETKFGAVLTQVDSPVEA